MSEDTKTKIETLEGIIDELKDRIIAEPEDADLPPLLVQAEQELAAEQAAEKAAEAAAAEAAQAAKAAAASAAASSPAAAAAQPAASAPTPQPHLRVMPERPLVPPTLVAGNVTAAGHPSRLPPAARPTKN